MRAHSLDLPQIEQPRHLVAIARAEQRTDISFEAHDSGGARDERDLQACQ